jgi:hypothetical protein
MSTRKARHGFQFQVKPGAMTIAIFTIQMQKELEEGESQATNYFIQMFYMQQIIATKQEDTGQASSSDAEMT